MGFANPQQHDNVIHNRANPQAFVSEKSKQIWEIRINGLIFLWEGERYKFTYLHGPH
jgi:hypothetical protein